jgi:phosphatidylinositol glycan class W
MIIPSILVSLTSRSQVPNGKQSGKKDPVKELLPKKPFITAYRGSMLIVTALAILAVDFPIFPRRFAKVETWGTSLMDLGVGSFVFSMGIVSTRSIIVARIKGIKESYLSKIVKSLRNTTTCLALGMLRLVFIKNLEYQEHVTEYGVHWNFFITLVLVGPLTILLDPIFDYIPRCIVSLIISMAYEYSIVKKEGFLSFLLLAPRTDLLSANREGIYSLVGYLAIFLAGQSTGFYVLTSSATKNNLYKPSATPLRGKKSTFTKLTSVSPITGLISWFVIYTSLFKFVRDNHSYNVSRRLANLPYVLWVCAYNTGFLLCYAMIDKFLSPGALTYDSRIPVSLDAINSNGMAMFLLANVFTGLVNMSMNTLDAGKGVSIAVLISYSMGLAIVGAVLYKTRLFIKL